MNRIPPNLLYLAIYNPALHSSDSSAEHNEDAEEQAHILFYTSKERAVSRDRMLRQIGLAKALANFTELFNTDDLCNNIHSQSRRMIMVSPEPNFWIHAGIELAKVPQVTSSKSKGKSKAKPLERGTEKEKGPGPTYDYDDGSVNDVAIREHVLRVYERFKLTHGSFTSIISTLGQQALELQLDRFFTVWAWSWNLEDGPQICEQLGSPLHPSFSALIPILDDFCALLSDETVAAVLSPSTLVPSTRYTNAGYPPSLIDYLMSIVPPSTSTEDRTSPLSSSVDTIKGKVPAMSNPNQSGDPKKEAGNFLGMPAMNVNMDVRKWNWPGYLTFGRGSSSKPNISLSLETKQIPPSYDSGNKPNGEEVQVDTTALEDAMSSSTRSIFTTSDGGGTDLTPSDPSPNDTNKDVSPPEDDDLPASPTSSSSPSLVSDTSEEPAVMPSPPPFSDFLIVGVHLAPPSNPTATKRRRVHYHIRNRLMLVLLDMTEDNETRDLELAAKHTARLLDDLDSATDAAAHGSLFESLPSANKILQPLDTHIVSTGQYTLSSPKFVSKSSHLYNAMAMQEIDPGITEVFSRGQNPQHWHVAKRGLGSNDGDGGEVYLEVFRKEASLTDVDNVLAGIVRRSSLMDGSV
ncbi:uncharacterized protein LACBIDRAFT_305341 [Laccaria bicolor S238N-H82]|uniref:Predicted protein n=1 Tax=Laccaria bicolor (strain S238N-H82 / ATCC MYA-4686) TaxID=486041 RepID=B0CU01_LACBS|nr:uncharacterized protein LACBIDRAFT_305341 [Laccaria bicolor S238N-H82]EDR14001.1 predicted protein [Laccaria bicolor S238N-H82]|eukprot:XP_001874560.1 predicted protein [Laccaria bicolor S238N-H82]